MLLAIDLHEDLVNVEGVTVAPVLSFQSACVNGTELNTPKADRFAADSDAAFSEQVFYISVAEIEFVVEPDSVGDDVSWESVALVGIHHRIISFPAFNLAVPFSIQHYAAI
jgi:hypothetical protein